MIILLFNTFLSIPSAVPFVQQLDKATKTTEKRKQLEIEKEITTELIGKYKVLEIFPPVETTHLCRIKLRKSSILLTQQPICASPITVNCATNNTINIPNTTTISIRTTIITDK